jgi:hypothetical protein
VTIQSVLNRVFNGPPEARMKELEEHVLFILHNRGMQHLLTALITVVKTMPDTPARAPYAGKYLKTLARDLQTTLDHYMARYELDPDLPQDAVASKEPT